MKLKPFRHCGCRFSRGMGARPHVSEAKLNPVEDDSAAHTSIADDLAAWNRSLSRPKKQTAVQQVLA